MGYHNIALDIKIAAVKDCFAGVSVSRVAQKYNVDRRSLYIWSYTTEKTFQDALTRMNSVNPEKKRFETNDLQNQDQDSLLVGEMAKTMLEEENKRLWGELKQIRQQGRGRNE